MVSKAPPPSPIITPTIDDVLIPVVERIENAIPEDFRSSCQLADGSKYPNSKSPHDRAKFLESFVRQELDLIAQFEYHEWLNGRMPFVGPRELQLWRLRQFAEHIWDWEIPDDEILSVTFNLTPRQAGTLAINFFAKFSKTHVLPRLLERILTLFEAQVGRPTPWKAVDGRVYRVPNRRYVAVINQVILPLLKEMKPHMVFYETHIHLGNIQFMWVSQEVVDELNDPKIRKEIRGRYPLGRSTP